MVATLAAVALLVSAMLFFADEKSMDYFSLVQFRAVTHENLAELLTIAGLFLVVCICLVSWVLALYGSFRVAGPLYRLSRNLELAPVSPNLIGVRKGDCFQDVSQQLRQAVDRVHEHYSLMGRQLNTIEGMFESKGGAQDELDAVIAKVKEDIHRVRLD